MKVSNLEPSSHADAAKALIEKVRALRDEIPRFTPAPSASVRRAVPKLRLSDDALEAACVEIQGKPRLETAAGADAPSLRDSSAYAVSYGPVVTELMSVARGLAYAINVERAKANSAALDIYALARRMSKRPEGAEFLPFVEFVRMRLKHRKGRKTNSSPDSAPVVTPAP